jgi:molybdate transport system substrate-binding protein
MIIRSTAIAILGLAGTLAAQTGPVHVLCSNGVRAVIEELRPQCERSIGHALEIQFGSTNDLAKKIEAGEPFDVTILTTEAIERLIRAGRLAPTTRADIARCGVGVGIRAGAPKPDISTPDAMKAALLKAKAVTYAEDGASRVFVEKMEQTFGIADQMKAKTLLTHGSGAANQEVVAGKADMVLTLGSEILPVHGVQLIGPLPAAVQGYVNFGAGASANTQNADAAKAVIQFLKSPAAAPVYKAKGMQAR